MLGDLMNKMQEMKKSTDEAKQRLENITVTGEALNGKITIKANGNKKILDISIADELLSEKDELQDYLIIAMNNVYKNAENVHEAEMKSIAKGLLPGFPGVF